MSNDQQHLQRLREHELSMLLPFLPPRAKILEIGAGMGWQAKALAAHGFEVTAIDLPAPLTRVWPVQEYDGEHIPFADEAFDVVFSSNVLEHVPHVVAFQRELQRVLKPGGLALHILPSSSWRFWTNLAYYPHLARRLAQKFFIKPESEARGEESTMAGKRNLLQTLLPPRHGEVGNFLSEIYWFSRWRWQRLFRTAGWRVVDYQRSGLFYTGYVLLGLKLGLNVRQSLSYFMGSACHVFALKRSQIVSTKA